MELLTERKAWIFDYPRFAEPIRDQLRENAERVRACMRRARLEGQRIGRTALALDRAVIMHNRQHGMSLGQIVQVSSII